MLRAQRHSRNKYKGYSQDSLVEALTKIKNGTYSVRGASMQYHIPKTTLLDKINGRTPVQSTQGPNPVLTQEEEGRLEEWIVNMSRIGYGQTRRELCLTVKRILDEDGRKNPFKDNLPGPQWVRAFLKRHPKISERTGEALGKERAMLSAEKLEEWFRKFENYMKSEEVPEGQQVLSDGRRIFNCDESGFPLTGKVEKVLAPKGAKNVYQFSNSDKRQITVLACMNATGYYVEPMLIFPNSRFRYNPLEGAPESWCVGRSSNGWINSEIFFEWTANHFLPQVKAAKIPLPVILLIDGHSSHISYETAKFCSENDIILYCLPAHSSHVLQPCDLSLFRSLKGAWKVHTKNWKIQHVGQTLTKMQFASVFAGAWKSAATIKNAQTGFETAGIFPLDVSRFDREKLAPSVLFRKRPNPEVPETETPARTAPQNKDLVNEQAIALKVLEATLSEEKVWLFERRLREGYDLDSDHLYNTWKQIKSSAANNTNKTHQATTAAVVHPLAPEVQPSPLAEKRLRVNAVSEALDRHLRYPTAEQAASAQKDAQRKSLPHAISGKVFIQYLEEKKKAKEDEETRKRINKEKREANKKAKTKKGKQTTAVEDPSDEERIDENKCAKCSKEYDDDDENWIGCEFCDRWFHKECTDIMGAAELTDSELSNLEWQCDQCM